MNVGPENNPGISYTQYTYTQFSKAIPNRPKKKDEKPATETSDIESSQSTSLHIIFYCIMIFYTQFLETLFLVLPPITPDWFNARVNLSCDFLPRAYFQLEEFVLNV